MTLNEEGSIGAYTLRSIWIVDSGTVGSSVVERHFQWDGGKGKTWDLLKSRVEKGHSEQVENKCIGLVIAAQEVCKRLLLLYWGMNLIISDELIGISWSGSPIPSTSVAVVAICKHRKGEVREVMVVCSFVCKPNTFQLLQWTWTSIDTYHRICRPGAALFYAHRHPAGKLSRLNRMFCGIYDTFRSVYYFFFTR